MKKLIALLLVFSSLFSILSLTGCQFINSNRNESENTQDETNKEEQSENTQDETNKEEQEVICDKYEYHNLVYGHLSNGNLIYYSCSERQMEAYRAIYQETGCNPVVRASDYKEIEVEDSNGEKKMQKFYTNVIINPYYASGMNYGNLSEEDFEAIQEYQNRTGRQVLYPLVSVEDTGIKNPLADSANSYYKVSGDRLTPELDENGNFIACYQKYNADEGAPDMAAEYNSLRIEGENGFIGEDGEQYYYVYGKNVGGGAVRVRMFRWEYYIYLKETNPNFTSSAEDYFHIN